MVKNLFTSIVRIFTASCIGLICFTVLTFGRTTYAITLDTVTCEASVDIPNACLFGIDSIVAAQQVKVIYDLPLDGRFSKDIIRVTALINCGGNYRYQVGYIDQWQRYVDGKDVDISFGLKRLGTEINWIDWYNHDGKYSENSILSATYNDQSKLSSIKLGSRLEGEPEVNIENLRCK